jgi:arabinofuranosyltransferase
VNRPLVRLALLVPLAAALVAHSLVYNFVSDDAYISFVYSRNLAEHGQLVFNLGSHVEGYTNFLWTVILGGLMKVGIEPELSARVLGTAFAVGTMGLVLRLGARLGGGRSLWDYLAPALLAASSGFACWSSGGLETQLFTFLVTGGALCMLEERWALSGLTFALAAMTRPEGALIFAVACLHRFVVYVITERRFWPRRAELVWVACFLALYVPYFAWRLWYYGWLFPNTFYVKAGGEPTAAYKAEMLRKGLFYVWQWATQSKAIFAAPLAIAGIVRHPRFGTFLAAVTVFYLGYTVSVGGDFMGLHRFIMPLFVFMALLTALGLRAAMEWLSAPRVIHWIPAVILVGFFAFTQMKLTRAALVPGAENGIDSPGYLKLYAHDRELIGKALAPLLNKDDFSIVGGAGVQPYYARMRAIDVFGLISEDIAHNEPPTNPRPGHQKWARPERILKYHPTFIFYCYALHTDPTAYRLCSEAATFQRKGYAPATLFVPGLRERGEYYTFLKRCDRACPRTMTCQPCSP